MTAKTRAQGTAQPGRASPLDSAARLPIDGLPREALLAFSAQVASLIRHATPPEEPQLRSPEREDSSFAPFFEFDIEVQLAVIASFRPEVAAAPLRGEIARLPAGASALSPDERVRVVSVVKAQLATLHGWWARLQGPPGVSGLGALQLQVTLLAPFARQLKNLVQQLVVGPLQDLLSALPELFEVTRGLDPALWGPVAQGAKVEPAGPPSGTSVADLLSRLATSIQDTEQRLACDARGWLASHAVKNAARPPHMALFLAFLDLLESPRGRMNGFALNHLRYYHETVLGQTPRGPEPDRAFVVVRPVRPATSPQPPLPPVFLPGGTALAAGKDTAGLDRTYQLLADVQVDLAAVARLLTLAATPNPKNRSGQGLVATDSRAGNRGNPVPAEVGFALASAVFALAGGERHIGVTMQLGAPSASASSTSAVAYFNVRLTGPDGWVQLDQQAVLSGSALTLDATLTAAQPAVVRYQSKLHGPWFADGIPPVLLFVLDEAGSPAPATALAAVTLSAVKVTVTVDSTPAFQLAGPTGPLALGKPFAPLGYAPPAGAALLVACPEALEKQLTKLTLHLTWQNLPAKPLYHNDIRTYYDGYELGLPGYVRPAAAPHTSRSPEQHAITQHSFKVALSYRLGGAWKPLTDETQPLPLFDSTTETTFCLDGSKGHALPTPAGAAATPFKWQPLPPDGVLQIQLVTPPYGFGAALCPIATAELARWNVDYVIDKVKGKSRHSTPKPPFAALNPPLTPLATDLTVGYDAEALLDARSTDDLTLYQLSPWLAEPVTMQHESRRIAPEPVPLFSDSVRGCILLAGITAATPGRSVACLVTLGQHGQLAAGPAGRSALSWRYFGGEGVWTPLRVEDRTGQLCRSGIVSFEVPADAVDWKGMGTGLVWIKVEVTDITDYVALPTVTGVFAQATECARVTTAPGGSYDVPLPAGTIVGLKTVNPRIAGLSQPLPTAGGRRAEDQDAMYRRVSERTRHKNRAVTVWDFERLALERYPSLFAVRCLPGVERQPDGRFQRVDRGVVTLLVSPRGYDPGALSADRYPPMVDDATLGQIQQDLASLASASAEIQVWNPVYVPVTVAARLTARAGQDPSMVGPRLDADLRAFLSPWIFQPDSASSLGGPESTAQVRRFLLGRPDIQTIQSVSYRMDASLADAGSSLRLPATPWMIPVSAWQHELVVSLSAR